MKFNNAILIEFVPQTNPTATVARQRVASQSRICLHSRTTSRIFSHPSFSLFPPSLLRYNISWSVDSHTPIEEYKLSFRKLPQGHEVVDNAIDSQSSSSSSSSLSSSSSSQMYGSSTHNHRMGNNLANYGGYGNLMHWGHNDWRNVVLPSFPLSHHYTQGMSYMVRGLDPDQQYEATVQSR